jgi:hypothetical protein
MNKILLVVTLVTVGMSLFAQAQITPYGSARVGYWFESFDEDHANAIAKEDGADSRLRSRYFIQTNSRFGVNFRNEGLVARVEFDGNVASGNVGLRLLWARQSFDGWSLLIGQDADGTNLLANQVYHNAVSGDLGLNNYGSIDGSRNPQIKFEMTNGFYLALLTPHTSNRPTGLSADATNAIDIAVPKTNIGHSISFDNIKVMPTAMVQYYSWNKDIVDHDGSVLSWLVAGTVEYSASPILIRGHFNYGSNTHNMGFAGSNNSAIWDSEKNETVDTATLGGYLMFGYDINPTLNLNLGIGYASSSNDRWEEDDPRMALYAQATYRAQRLRIIPEIGLINEMDGNAGQKQGSAIYFGTQLRLDF